MLSVETLRAVRAHAGLEASEAASVADALARSEGVDAALADLLDVLQQLNIEMHGPVPSESVGDDDATLPRNLVYAVAEVARMLRDAAREDDAWVLDTGWLAVLAGDVDDIAEHVALERAAQS